MPLRLRGGGTKDFYGQIPSGMRFDTCDYRGIIAHEPSELVITARCGTPLAEIEAALAQKNQILPFEPPHFGTLHGDSSSPARSNAAATLGGCVAAGLSGPRRATAGALRDFVLGVRMMDGQGAVLAFGGQVMKNVAGYDVSRLLAGSLGMLGLILEVSLKVLPRPARSATVQLEYTEAEATQRLNMWIAAALPVSASFWHAGCLTVRLCGATAAVEAARRHVGGTVLDDTVATTFWASVREQTHTFFADHADKMDESSLWRIALPAMSAPLTLPGTQAIEWNGALRWWKTDAQTTAESIRAAARQAGGHASLFRASEPIRAVTPVFQPLDPVSTTIHRRLKEAFDPSGILNPGRMFAEPSATQPFN